MNDIKIVGGFERMLSNKEVLILRDLMEYGDLKQLFGNHKRLYGSHYQGLIKYKDDYAGFFLLVRECVKGIYFIDRGIKEEYRNQKIGTYVMEYIVNNFRGSEFLISETKEDNILSNSSASNVGKLVYKVDNINYYLLNKEEEEFKSSEIYNSFLEYENSSKIKQKIYRGDYSGR